MRLPVAQALACAALLLAAFSAGCGGAIPATRYYALDAGLPAAPPPASAKFPLEVAVARFRTPQMLAQDRVVFRPSPVQVDYYNYHRWSGFPADLVTEAFIGHLRRSGLFKSVSSIQSGAKADILMRGQILSLEEVNSGDGVAARVALTLEALDNKTRAVVWSGRASHENAVAERTVEGVVRELNDGVRKCFEQLSQDLAQRFPAK
jgi:ABC-type uncharacterized transport system auxiliary subunit